jgi:hypothetical protein
MHGPLTGETLRCFMLRVADPAAASAAFEAAGLLGDVSVSDVELLAG